MEHTEESNCIASTPDKNPHLGGESGNATSDTEEIQEQVNKQLTLKPDEQENEAIDEGSREYRDYDDRDSIGWHQDDDFNSERENEAIGEGSREYKHYDDRESIGWHQDDDFNSEREGNGGEEEEEEEVEQRQEDAYDFDYEKVGGDEISSSSNNNNNNNHVNRRQQHQYQYPVRPEAEDCAYYMKTGTCKFGSNCKFNHPARRKMQVAKEKVKEREEVTDKPGQTECKYYLRTGGCKYGKNCRYNHTRVKPPVFTAKTTVFPALDLNFLGLPIRPGERECPYYMRNGSCKYGADCRFNHPDPTAVGGSDPPSVFSNGGSASLQNSSQSTVTSWSSPRGLNETPHFLPIMFSPTQGVPSQSPEWNGYQAHIYAPEGSMHQPPPYVISNQTTDINVYAHQQQIPIDEFPERPGQQECSYYMKTGDCKFKSNCKYHHPKNHIISKPPPCALSDKGLPLRPGQSICSYYNRYGICKFGPACKFDHPIQASSADDLGASYTDSAAKEEARMAETANGNDTAIQQTL